MSEEHDTVIDFFSGFAEGDSNTLVDIVIDVPKDEPEAEERERIADLYRNIVDVQLQEVQSSPLRVRSLESLLGLK